MRHANVAICRIIAGSNGASTFSVSRGAFALLYLRQFPEAQAYGNADLIAAGLSPLAPQRLRAAGWRVELIVLALPSVELSILRVAERVAHGGHNVPLPVLERRFPRSLQLLLDAYAPAVDHALCNMNSGAIPAPVFVQTGAERTIVDPVLYSQFLDLA